MMKAVACMLALAGSFAIAATAQATAAECPAERAVYTMASDEGSFSITFVPARSFASMASDLYVQLTTPQRDYWFALAMSMGYGGTSLLPVSDPYDDSARDDGPRQLLDRSEDGGSDILPSLRFYALDAELNFADAPPMKGEPALPYLMAPELGLTLWYEPAALSEDAAAERDPMPRGLFRLTDCKDAAPPEAWP